jgi:hypothetical protein
VWNSRGESGGVRMLKAGSRLDLTVGFSMVRIGETMGLGGWSEGVPRDLGAQK